MATTKDRINITLPKLTRAALKIVAKRDAIPEATKASELLTMALEIEEDLALGAIAEARMKKGGRLILDSDIVWK